MLVSMTSVADFQIVLLDLLHTTPVIDGQTVDQLDAHLLRGQGPPGGSGWGGGATGERAAGPKARPATAENVAVNVAGMESWLECGTTSPPTRSAKPKRRCLRRCPRAGSCDGPRSGWPPR